MFKIGAMSIALERLVEQPEPDAAQILRAAARAGVEGVEFYQTHWGAGEGDVEAAPALRALAGELGVEVFAVGSGARLGHADGRRQEAVETLKRQVRAAAAVGAGVVTFPAIDAPPVLPGERAEQEGTPFVRAAGPLVEQLQELAGYAGERGVRLALLNHCYFVSCSWHQEWALRLAERASVGACLDPGNYLYYECEDPVGAARRLAGRVFNVRLGDWVRREQGEVAAEFWRQGRLQIYAPALFGQGEVDHRACLEILAQSGYRGYLSLKSAGPAPGGPGEALGRALEGVRGLVEEVRKAGG